MTAKLPVETLILSHANADFDAFAGMLAAQLLYPGARICLHGGVNRNVREFYNLHADQIPSVEPSAVDRDSRAAARARRGHRAPSGSASSRRSAARDGCRGRRLRPPRRAASSRRATALVGRDGSVVTGMLKLLLERGIEHLADARDGVRARHPRGHRARSRTRRPPTATSRRSPPACGWARTRSCSRRYLRGPLQPDQRDLLRQLDREPRREREVAGPAGRVGAGAQADGYVEDVSTLVSRVGEVADWDVLVLSVEMEGRVLRRRAQPHLRARRRRGARGARRRRPRPGRLGIVRETDADAVLERALAEVGRVAQAPLRAGDVMSRPVHAVAERRRHLRDARRVPAPRAERDPGVRERRTLTGIVSREDLDRAVRHGLSHAPVKGVMSAGVPVVGARGDARRAARAARDRARAARLVVVAEGPYRSEAAGAGRGRRGRRHAAATCCARCTSRWRSSARCPTRRRPPRCASGSARSRASRRCCRRSRRWRPPYDGVYLVGGAVRDVLLGEQSLDLDLMVEGDALAFARALARRAGRARCHPHEKFQTAVVKGARPRRERRSAIDVATARTEFYGAPGALPEVERSTLRHDLARRDFTINAMATSLRAEDLGATYDFFGGFRDLQPKHGARAAQPQLRRGPDAPAARDPLRGAARLPRWTGTRSRSRAGASRCGWSATSPRRGCATS